MVYRTFLKSPLPQQIVNDRFSLVFSRRFLTRIEWTCMMEKQPLSGVVLKLGGGWYLPQLALDCPRSRRSRPEKGKKGRQNVA